MSAYKFKIDTQYQVSSDRLMTSKWCVFLCTLCFTPKRVSVQTSSSFWFIISSVPEDPICHHLYQRKYVAQLIICEVASEVLTAIWVWIVFFWVVAACSLLAGIEKIRRKCLVFSPTDGGSMYLRNIVYTHKTTRNKNKTHSFQCAFMVSFLCSGMGSSLYFSWQKKKGFRSQ
jgi:hypothetical protein